MNDASPGAGLRLTIDLCALRRNWRRLAALAAPAECAAVVKADAYGTGIEEVVPVLAATGCRTFFVAWPAEAGRVRRVAPEAGIYVLSGFGPGLADFFRSARLRPVLNSPAQLALWIAAGVREPAALHFDTGMNRLGLETRDAVDLARGPNRAAVELGLLMSHLACADEPAHPLNGAQLGRFAEVVEHFGSAPRSIANSAGIHLGRTYHFDMVRPGIALYGGASHPAAESECVVTAEARILQVRTAAKGETVGYGAAQRLARNTRIAILGSGYADGYQRAGGASDSRRGGQVWVDGSLAPILGRVSMDLTAVDVTDIPERAARPNDWVELFGANLSIDRAAAAAGTIAYEFLTGLSSRAERIYLRDSSVMSNSGAKG